jgi:hypothetical protein
VARFTKLLALIFTPFTNQDTPFISICFFIDPIPCSFASPLNLISGLFFQSLERADRKFKKMKPYLFQGLKTFFRGTIGVSLILSFSVYAWARILFYEVPFSAKEDFSILFKLTGLSWAMILGLKVRYTAL